MPCSWYFVNGIKKKKTPCLGRKVPMRENSNHTHKKQQQQQQLKMCVYKIPPKKHAMYKLSIQSKLQYIIRGIK